MAELAVPIAIGGAALGAVGSIAKGKEEAASAKFDAQQLRGQAGQYEEQAKQYEIQAQTERIAAADAEAKRRDGLISSLETIEAIRAGRGVGGVSPTGAGITEGVLASGEKDVRTERLNYLQKEEEALFGAKTSRFKAGQATQAAAMAERKAKSAVTASFFEAGSKIGSAALSFAKPGK